MSNELRAKLMATPAVKLANIGLGEHAYDPGMKILHSLSQRRIWIRQGLAMQDGSFPIPNVAHLKYALEAYEFAENRRKTQRWITRRAKNLSRIDLLPAAWQARALIAAAGEEVEVHKGAMIAIYPPPELAEVLAGPKATDEPAEELHVTLAFLADEADFTADQIVAFSAAIAIAIEGTEPLEASVQGYGTFVNGKDEGDPQWYSVNCPGLAKFRSKLVDTLTEQAGFELPTDYDFVPHMTVRYGEPAVTAIPDGGEKSWPVTEVYLVVAGNKLPFPFKAETSPDEALDELAVDEDFLAQFRGNPEALRDYWQHGKGATAIRWGTDGDFDRCVRSISKYVTDPQGTCAQWHHDTTGKWPREGH